MKSSVQWKFEYTFFALTLNPMGKRRCLEIEDYAGDTTGNTRRRMRQSRTKRLLHSPSIVSVSGPIHCGPTVVSAKTSMKEETERSINGINRFLHIQIL